MSTERDELAEVIGYTYNNSHMDPAGHSADAVLAAGYQKLRTITTPEELDALPDGSIIMDGRGQSREGLRTMGSGNVWRAMGPAKVLRSKEIALPATVLYEQEAVS